MIPCHLESKAIALATVASVLDSSYPNERLHIFLSMDGEENQFLAREIAKGLGIAFQEGCCLPYADVWMNGIRLTISIFPHGGKPNCLANTVDFIQRNHKLYLQSPTDTHVLMLDSDTVVSADMITLAASRLVSDMSPTRVPISATDDSASPPQLRKAHLLSLSCVCKASHLQKLPCRMRSSKPNISSTVSLRKWPWPP